LALKPSHTTSKPARCKAWRVFFRSPVAKPCK